MYDYIDVHRLTNLAFGWSEDDAGQIGRRYGVSVDGVGFRPPRYFAPWYRRFGEEQRVKGRSLREYIVDMQEHFAEVHRVARPGAIIAYVFGSSTHCGKRFGLAAASANLIREAGFQEIELVTRIRSRRRILPAGRDAATGQFSSDAAAGGVAETIIYAQK